MGPPDAHILNETVPDAAEKQLRETVAPVEMPFSRWSLRFHDPRHDADFSAHICQRMLGVVQITLLLGCVIYASFGILDAIVAPDHLAMAMFIRLGIVCPIILIAFFMLLSKFFIKYYQFILSIVTLISSISLTYIIINGNEFVVNNYFIGIIITFFYCANLFYIRFHNIIISILSANASYFYLFMSHNTVDDEVLYSQIFFMASGSSLSLYCSYAQEYFLIKDYINRLHLARTAHHIEDLYIKANAANHAKSEFLTVMSHELRTPLNAVIGFSEIIAGEMLGQLQNEKYKEYATDINNSGKHLLSIINDILDLTRAETGKLQLHEDDFTLSEVLRLAMNMIVGKAGEKGVRLGLDYPDDTIIIYGDQRLLKQAIINLLSNAVKFTDGGKQVIVNYGQRPDGSVFIAVTDEGVGIPEEHLERVLEPFVQVENSFTRVNDGIGIGLPLVRRIIELHDGSMNIQSRVGAGTCVTLQIPAKRALFYPSAIEVPAVSAPEESRHGLTAQ